MEKKWMEDSKWKRCAEQRGFSETRQNMSGTAGQMGGC